MTFGPGLTHDGLPMIHVVREFVVHSPGAVLTVRDSAAAGEPLLLLHGGPGVPDAMQTTIVPLIDGLRCVSFDQRGVGASRCDDGRYDLAAYVADIEAIRERLALPTWHVLGHSWGGLLAQAYAAAHPGRVRTLVLSSSSLGVGADWTRTKRVSMRIECRRAGVWGTARLLFYGSGLYVPGPVRERAVRRVMAEIWRDYFLDPASAPAPDLAWLAGCSARAMVGTDRALRRTSSTVLAGIDDCTAPAMVLYGEHDIFGDAAQIVRHRLPHAEQVTLTGSGHLHWLQNTSGYRNTLRSFYAKNATQRRTS